MVTPTNAAGMAAPPLPQPAPSGRWVRVALAVSLAFNLGIVGIVAGAIFRDGPKRHDGIIARELGFGPFTDALSKEDREALRSAFIAAAPAMRDGHRAMQADFGDLLAQLRAVPFDANELRVVFDRQNARNAERLDLGQRLIFDLLVGMKADARKAFADRLEQSLAKGPKRRDPALGQ